MKLLSRIWWSLQSAKVVNYRIYEMLKQFDRVYLGIPKGQFGTKLIWQLGQWEPSSSTKKIHDQSCKVKVLHQRWRFFLFPWRQYTRSFYIASFWPHLKPNAPTFCAWSAVEWGKPESVKSLFLKVNKLKLCHITSHFIIMGPWKETFTHAILIAFFNRFRFYAFFWWVFYLELMSPVQKEAEIVYDWEIGHTNRLCRYPLWEVNISRVYF